MGFALGIVKIRVPLDITMCFPWRMTRNPDFSKARTAFRWGTPGNFPA